MIFAGLYFLNKHIYMWENQTRSDSPKLQPTFIVKDLLPEATPEAQRCETEI